MTDQRQFGPLVVAQSAPQLLVTDLDNEIWLRCQPIAITHYWSGESAPTSRHAEVRLCWNDEGLIVKFVCQQHEALIVSEEPITEVKTIGLWDRDVCEIFVAPDPTNPGQYFEFEAAPTGEWIDLAIQIKPEGRETEWDYQSGMKTFSRIAEHQIIVALSIPWSGRIPKPIAGDEWRANLFRCVGPDEATRYLAWRPTGTPEPNYHVPEAFGVLRFA